MQVMQSNHTHDDEELRRCYIHHHPYLPTLLTCQLGHLCNITTSRFMLIDPDCATGELSAQPQQILGSTLPKLAEHDKLRTLSFQVPC